MEIQTTGDLRGYLVDLMSKVENRQIDLDVANVIIKASSQVNISLNVEVKAQQLSKQAGEERAEYGKMKVI